MALQGLGDDSLNHLSSSVSFRHSSSLVRALLGYSVPDYTVLTRTAQVTSVTSLTGLEAENVLARRGFPKEPVVEIGSGAGG